MSMSSMSWLGVAAALSTLALPPSALAQSAPVRTLASTRAADPVDDVPSCDKAKPRASCRVRIDRRLPVSGRSVTVESGTVVTLVLENKSPFESCQGQVKREELPDVSGVPAALALLKELAGPLVLMAGAPKSAGAKPTRDDIARTLDDLMQGALERAHRTAALHARYEGELRQLAAFYGTEYFEDGPSGHDKEAFEVSRAARHTAITRVVSEEPPGYAVGDVSYRKVVDAYFDYAASPGAVGLPELEAQIDRARQALDVLARAISAIEDARTKLRSTLVYLQALERAQWKLQLPFHGDRNAKVTATIGCTSDVTGKPTLEPPLAYTVKFQDTPRVSLTAGILLSAVPRNSIAIESVVDSAIGNKPAAHEEIVQHPARPQAVPFSFLNVRLLPPHNWGGRRVTINAAPGFGVNSNNGDVSAEFFAGASIGFDSLFLAVGWHVGHEVAPANGYAVGNEPPNSLTEVPVRTSWTTGAAFAVSYRIPLK